MKLVQIKCPSCGAKLERKNDSKEITCTYCGITTIIDDEVIKVEHYIKNDISELKYQNADTYLYKMKNYDLAFKQYKSLSDLEPSDPRVWYGQLLSLTKDFSDLNIYSDPEKMKYLREIYQNYLNTSTDEKEKEIIRNKYNSYVELLNEKIDSNPNKSILKVIGAIVIITFVAMFLISIFSYFDIL